MLIFNPYRPCELSSISKSQWSPHFVGCVAKRVKQQITLLVSASSRHRKSTREDNNITSLVHWTLCCKHDLSRNEKWYDHQPDGVVENERCKILWDMTIRCDHVIEARRSDLLLKRRVTRQLLRMLLHRGIT